MKKLLTILVAFVLGVCCLGLVACNGGDGDSSVAGTYKFYSQTVVANGQTIASITVGSAEATAAGLTADSMIFDIKADGSVDMTNAMYPGNTIEESGTWTLDGDQLSITIDNDTQTFTVSGDTITIVETFSDDNVPTTMTLVLKKA